MPWPPIHRAALLAAVALAVVVVLRLDRRADRWRAHLRSRFLLALPLGSLTSALFVLAVYLFLQGGLWNWYAPTTIPFRAWSYFYPLGMVTAPFSHVGPNHVVGNLVGALTLGTVAEYAWGHYPRERGTATFSSLRTNPYVRALVVVPVVILLTGLFTSLFAIGPIIGFSGVVFALAGFALVFRPFTAVLALMAGSVVRLGYSALLTPTTTAEAKPFFSTPWWADVAIQGHAIGLFAGVLLATMLARRRGPGSRPSALRLGTGVVLFSVAQSLWAVYWFRGNQTFVLYRALGLALVFVLAAVVAVAVTASARPLRAVPEVPVGESLRTVPRWQVGMAVLLLVTAALAGPAVPVNLVTAGGDELPGESVSVRDYEVAYAENVQNGMVSVVDVEAFGESTAVNTSGVIVRSADRNIWLTAVPKGRLAFDGRARVRLGGVGWRESVQVTRSGWKAVGGNATYRVVLTQDGENTTAYVAPPARADPVIEGRNVSVAATETGFDVIVAGPDSRARAPVPGPNGLVVLNDIIVLREGDRLIAVTGETRVPVAEVETYRGQQD